MASVRPFRGTFFNLEVVKDLAAVTAPPYDVIDERKKEILLARSPYNIVRLELPQPGSEREFWNRSATLFRAWKKGEVLCADAAPCLYLYRQAFELLERGRMERTGIIAVLECKDFSSGEIMPHEKTFARIRMERLQLLRACRANFSQVFMVFRDDEEAVLPQIEEAAAGPAFLEFRDDEGVEHRLWRLEEGGGAERLARALDGMKMIIADGHHRYETALAYGAETAGAREPGHPSRYVSVALFRSEDPGLVILPVHRLLKRLPLGEEETRERLARYFDVEVLRRDIAAREGMYRDLLEEPVKARFVVITRGGAVRLSLREGVDTARLVVGDESADWKRLDVSVLHSLVLGECLGLNAAELAEKGELAFTPWESRALSAVREGEAEAAFLMRAPRMEEVWNIAEGGERMPHKSTYFHPKLPSGMLIYDHETALG